MNSIRHHLDKLKTVRRRSYHPLLHHIHKTYRISRKTLFYVKEYGPHSNVPKRIFTESIRILLLAALISTLGGFAVEHVKVVFLSIIPLIILLPTLNDLVGDYATIISARFSTMLHEGIIDERWWLNKEVKKLFLQILIASFITAILTSGMALFISQFQNYKLNLLIAAKVFLIAAFVALPFAVISEIIVDQKRFPKFIKRLLKIEEEIIVKVERVEGQG